MATDRLSVTEEARLALRRLLTRAHQERGPQPAER